jgi:hypothetical protein
LNSGSPKEYTRDFSVANLSLSAANEKVALKGPNVHISYAHNGNGPYTVPGNIIIKDEALNFSNDKFEFYDIASGAKDSVSYPYEIGLSTKTEYF